MFQRTLKRITATVIAILMVFSMVSFAAAEAAEDVSSFADQFENASDLDSGLWSRWWFNSGDQSYEAIYDDMKNSIVDAGIVRVEVAKSYVWTDSEENMAAFYYVLKAASELGLTLDFATGNPYPAVLGTTVLTVDGVTYYDPADVGYSEETHNAYSINYAFKDVGEGLTDSDVLTGVSAWVSAGFMGMQQQADQTIEVDGDGGEKIVAVIAAYIAADGETILSKIDLTDNDAIITYEDNEDKHVAASITVDADQLNALVDDADELAATEADTEGGWKIFTVYTAKESNTVCYVNYYSTRAWCEYFEDYVIDNDAYWTEVMGLEEGEVRALFNEVGGGLWEDSLESISISYAEYAGIDENGEDYDIFTAFEILNGYEFPREDILALFVGGGSIYSMSGGFSDDADFVSDSVEDKQLRHDYFDTLTELYVNNHLGVYTEWAQAQGDGMDTRVQAAYMYALDQDKAYASVTIPEYETLNGSDRPDVNRGVAGAAHSSGNNVISSETGAQSVFFQGETYTMAWYDWLWHANVEFAAGVNQVVLHGIEYSYASSTTAWPGPSMAMPTAALAEPTGQRMPYYELMDETISIYLAREQLILQSGVADIDVAVYYYYNEMSNDYLDYFLDDCMELAGYTYDFLGDTSISTGLESSDGDVLFPEGSSYQALVINQYRQGETDDATGFSETQSTFEGNGYMPLDTAKAIQQLASQGLPIVIVDKAPDKSAKSADDYVDGEYIEGYGDEQVQAIFAEILTYDNVVLVESEADVADALAAMDVLPDSAFDQETALANDAENGTDDLYTYHREDENVDYYMVFNRSHTTYFEGEEQLESVLDVNKDHTIATYIEFEALEGSVPYLLDCWSGEITRIADYTITEDGRYRLYIEVEPSESIMIAFGTEDWYTDGNDDALTVLSSTGTASYTYDSEGALVAFSEIAGTFEAALSDGSTWTAEVASVPETISLTDGSVDWDLSLKLYKPTEEWIANPTTDTLYYDYEETGDSGISTITYEYIDGIDPLGDDGLLAWIYLEELGDNPERASGVGTYTTTVTIPDDYDADVTGYIMTLDEATELFVVTINGETAYFAQTGRTDTSCDVSALLQPGENEIEIVVASGLFNAVKYYNTAASAINSEITAQLSEETWTSEDGLIGDVILTGYTVTTYTNAE